MVDTYIVVVFMEFSLGPFPRSIYLAITSHFLNVENMHEILFNFNKYIRNMNNVQFDAGRKGPLLRQLDLGLKPIQIYISKHTDLIHCSSHLLHTNISHGLYIAIFHIFIM